MGAETEESRTAEVLLRVGADDVHLAVRALPANRQQQLARSLRTPVTVLTAADSAADIVRRRTRGLSRSSTSAVVRDLVEVCLDEMIDALGDRQADPSYEELVSAVDGVLERWNVRVVALVLAATGDGDFPASAVCGRVLDEDPRFARDTLGPVHDEITARPVTKAPTVSEAELEAKREQRRLRREAKATKSATPKAKASRRTYKKKSSQADETADPDGELFDAASPRVTVGERPLATTSAPLRRVTVVGNYPHVGHDDPLIGAVVTAFIPFVPEPDAEPLGKTRPCVVIAVSDRAHLVVRPCYSEGGMRSRSWRSVLITDARAAGLNRAGYVSDEEFLVERATATGPIGWLAREDWNML